MSRGIEDRRNKEQLKTLARERGAAAKSAQLLGDAQALLAVLADTKKRADGLIGQISDAEAALAAAVADMEAQIDAIEGQIPPVASSVANILSVLNGGTTGQHYVKGAAALGGVWAGLVGILADGAVFNLAAASGNAIVNSASGWSAVFSTSLSAASVDVVADAGYESAEVTWTFPFSFSAIPFVAPCQTNNAAVWAAVHSVTTASAKVKLKSFEEITDPVAFRLRAEGVR